jgi:hypothetical protein
VRKKGTGRKGEGRRGRKGEEGKERKERERKEGEGQEGNRWYQQTNSPPPSGLPGEGFAPHISRRSSALVAWPTLSPRRLPCRRSLLSEIFLLPFLLQLPCQHPGLRGLHPDRLEHRRQFKEVQRHCCRWRSFKRHEIELESAGTREFVKKLGFEDGW